MKIGLIPMAAKPYHAGHDCLVRIAAEENDHVKLFVSIHDRKRRGELHISGQKMLKIWRDFITASLPKNVQVLFVDSPVKSLLEELRLPETSKNTVSIYSDVEDIKKYTDKKLKAAGAQNPERIVRRGVSRTETVSISGTEMRQLLKTRSIDRFVSMLPSALMAHGREIYTILS
jgi:citrate lyase synthetase